MRVLAVVVRDKIATGSKDFIVCNNSDYFIKFDFDNEWSAYTTKTARFIFNGYVHDEKFEGDTVNVPIITKCNTVSVGVFAGDLQTTTPAIFPCYKSILSDDGLPHEQHPNLYQQILNDLDKKVNKEFKTGSTSEHKVLSDNNFSDNDKRSIHSHSNKIILDKLSQENIHTHNNKKAIDSISADKIKEWDDKVKSLPQWQPNTDYKIGDSVILKDDYNNTYRTFICNTKHTSENDLDVIKWNEIVPTHAFSANSCTDATYATYVMIRGQQYEIADVFAIKPTVFDFSYLPSGSSHSFDITDNMVIAVPEASSLLLRDDDNVLKYGFSITFTSGATPTSFTAPTSIRFAGVDCADGAFVPTENKTYNIIITQVGSELWGDVGAREVL